MTCASGNETRGSAAIADTGIVAQTERPPDFHRAKTILRIARSGRLDLAAQTLEERKGWPARIADFPAPDHEDILRATLGAVLGWIRRAEAHWGCGGIPASYDARSRRFGGPYPETTGYSIPTLLAAATVLEDPAAEPLAYRAADWLTGRQLGNGAMRCNIEPPGGDAASADQIVIFDCGAILQGLVAVAGRDESYAPTARRLGRFLVETQRVDGTWGRYLAFRQFGSHNALVGYALLDAGAVLDEPSFTEAGHRCLEAIRPRFRASGYIDGCEFPGVRRGVAFLHPLVYTIEGYLKAETVAPGHGYLETALPSLDALHADIERTGHVPGAFVGERVTTASSFTALTAVAQLADVGFKADRLLGTERYAGVSRQLMGFLRRCIAGSLRDAEWMGGVPSAFPINGEYLPFCVNNWGAKYVLDAGIEELKAQGASGPAPGATP